MGRLNVRQSNRRFVLLGAVLGGIIAACGGAGAAATPTPTSILSSTPSPTPTPKVTDAQAVAVARLVYYTDAHGYLAICTTNPATGVFWGYSHCPLASSLAAEYEQKAPGGQVSGNGGYILICFCQGRHYGPSSFTPTDNADGSVTVTVTLRPDVPGSTPHIYLVDVQLVDGVPEVTNLRADNSGCIVELVVTTPPPC